MIEFKKAAIGYGKKPVLQDVTCAIAPGELVGIVGPNGSGKTTFLRTVLGLLSPSAGSVAVDRGRRFAYVPQVDDLNLLWPLTTKEMVSLAVRSRRPLGRLSGAEAAAVDRSLDRAGLGALAGRRYDELSGGQRQRTVLAQALAQEPDVLLLDEPTRGLDVRVEHDFIELIRSLNRESGLTVLLVTHALAIPMNAAEKIFLFQGGTVVPTTSAELAGTDALERVYGTPFVHAEMDGVRWAWPRSAR